MAVLKILHYPHVLLRKKSEPVINWGKDLPLFVEHMVETMYAYQGIGLAAPQVGILKRIMVVDIRPYLENPELSDWHGQISYFEAGNQKEISWPMRIVNPEIIERSEKVRFPFDGCLSLPGLPATESDRDRAIVMKGCLPDGTSIEIRAEGILSICLQHEMDHLEGVLFIDRVSNALDDGEVQSDIRNYEEDPAIRKLERKLKPVEARKLNLDFVD